MTSKARQVNNVSEGAAQIYKELDYYRQDVNGKDAVSYQMLLLDDEEKTWKRSDGSGITGTWTLLEGKIYLNFDDPEEDKFNSGVYKGFRIFMKRDA